MLAWSSKRKLLYIGGFALLLAVIIFSYLYPRLNKAPTCMDGKQNGDELGVDCGGTCQAACLFQANDLIVRWTKAFPVSDGVYSLVAYAENQNSGVGVQNIPYEFKVYDADNVFIARRTGTTFIGPNSKVPILEAGVNAGNRIPKRVAFTFLQEPRWIQADPKTEALSIYVSDIKLLDPSGTPRLEAKFVNNSIYDVRNVPIAVIIYDAEGNAIAASKTLVEDLPKGGVKNLFFMWPSPFAAKVERIEVVPRLNVFEIDF